MKIAVLVKQVPDTWGDRRVDPVTTRVVRDDGDQVIDEIDERALEVALAYRDGDKATQVVSITMGPEASIDAVRKALAIGADSAVHIVDPALEGADASTSAAVLAATIRDGGYDLVLAGNISTDGRGGVVPAMIAEHLGMPQLSSLDEIAIGASDVTGTRSTDAGTQRLRADLPAIVTVTERMPEARFPGFKSIMQARKKPVQRRSASDLGLDSIGRARSVVLIAQERPPRAAGRVVVDEGQAAGELASFLVSEHLI